MESLSSRYVLPHQGIIRRVRVSLFASEYLARISASTPTTLDHFRAASSAIIRVIIAVAIIINTIIISTYYHRYS